MAMALHYSCQQPISSGSAQHEHTESPGVLDDPHCGARANFVCAFGAWNSFVWMEPERSEKQMKNKNNITKERNPYMKMNINQFLLTASLAVAASQLHGQATQTIDFDTVSSGTIVDTYYAPANVYYSTGQPVTFTDVGGLLYHTGGGHVYAVADPESDSAPNAVSVWPGNPGYPAGFNVQDGVIQATFSKPVSTVSIEVVAELDAAEDLGTTQNRPYLEAYDSAGTLITGEFYSQANVDQLSIYNTIGPRQVLTVTSSTANISYIWFSASYNAANDGDTARVIGVFDNLQYPGNPPMPLLPVRPFGPVIPRILPPLGAP
jgi:hypothetical protein